MKTAKRVIRRIGVVLLSIIMLSAVFGFAAGAAEDRSESYNQLAAMGLSTDFLDCITENMMNKIISIIGENEIADISYQGDGHPSNYSDNKDNLITKDVNIVLRDKATGKISGNCICVYWAWQNGKPIIKQKDHIKISWSNSKLVFDGESFYAEDYQAKNGDINVSNTYTSTSLSDVQIARDDILPDVGYFADLKHFGGQNSGCAVFNLLPAEPMDGNEEVKNNIYVEYMHNYKTTVQALVSIVVLIIAIAALFALITVINRKNKPEKKIASVV